MKRPDDQLRSQLRDALLTLDAQAMRETIAQGAVLLADYLGPAPTMTRITRPDDLQGELLRRGVSQLDAHRATLAVVAFFARKRVGEVPLCEVWRAGRGLGFAVDLFPLGEMLRLRKAIEELGGDE